MSAARTVFAGAACVLLTAAVFSGGCGGGGGSTPAGPPNSQTRQVVQNLFGQSVRTLAANGALSPGAGQSSGLTAAPLALANGAAGGLTTGGTTGGTSTAGSPGASTTGGFGPTGGRGPIPFIGGFFRNNIVGASGNFSVAHATPASRHIHSRAVLGRQAAGGTSGGFGTTGGTVGPPPAPVTTTGSIGASSVTTGGTFTTGTVTTGGTFTTGAVSSGGTFITTGDLSGTTVGVEVGTTVGTSEGVAATDGSADAGTVGTTDGSTTATTTGSTGGVVDPGPSFYFDDYLGLWVDIEENATSSSYVLYTDAQKTHQVGSAVTTFPAVWNTFPQVFVSTYSFQAGPWAGSHGSYRSVLNADFSGSTQYDDTSADGSSDAGASSWGADGSSSWTGTSRDSTGIVSHNSGLFRADGSGRSHSDTSDGFSTDFVYQADGSGSGHISGPLPGLPATIAWDVQGNTTIRYADGTVEQFSPSVVPVEGTTTGSATGGVAGPGLPSGTTTDGTTVGGTTTGGTSDVTPTNTPTASRSRHR